MHSRRWRNNDFLYIRGFPEITIDEWKRMAALHTTSVQVGLNQGDSLFADTSAVNFIWEIYGLSSMFYVHSGTLISITPVRR